jgi:hypothetical protein
MPILVPGCVFKYTSKNRIDVILKPAFKKPWQWKMAKYPFPEPIESPQKIFWQAQTPSNHSHDTT